MRPSYSNFPVRHFIDINKMGNPLMFEYYQDRAGEWRWRLKANNGRTTADSGEGYSTEAGCKAAIERVRNEVKNAQVKKV